MIWKHTFSKLQNLLIIPVPFNALLIAIQNIDSNTWLQPDTSEINRETHNWKRHIFPLG